MGKAIVFMPGNGLRVNYAKLRAFLDQFDAVRERYGYLSMVEDCGKCESRRECEEKGKCTCDNTIGLERARAKLAHQARVPFQNEYAHENHKKMMDNLRLVYGEEEPFLEEFPYIYTLVREKILDKYVGVKGLARLFNEHYWYLELPMMLELNHEKGEHRHNRDHFLHQVKNACELHVLLREMNLIHHTKSVLERGENPVAAYFQGSVSRSYDYMRNHSVQEEIYLKAFTKDGEKLHGPEQERFEKNVKNSLREYIIMGSLLTAALFHDIGYPVEFAMRQAEKLKEHSSMITFFLDYRDDFDNIASLLEDSLLFRITPPRLIRSKLEQKDHGTLSALLFLLYFYRTGIINTLPPDQEAVIELAGLAIFDHTLKYESIDKKHDNLHYRPTFYRNPISFLLRLCDDIQEWDRFKFKLEPKDRIAIHVCGICKMPVLPIALEQEDSDAMDGQERLRGQRCRCGDRPNRTLEKEVTLGRVDRLQSYKTEQEEKLRLELAAMKSRGEDNRAIERHEEEKMEEIRRELDRGHKKMTDSLLPRLKAANGTLLRIMNSGHREAEKIQPCDSILFRELSGRKSRHGHIGLEFEINAYDLLYLSTYDPEAVCYTAKEMVKICKNMADQSEFPLFDLRSQITNNPIDLKVQLMERYLLQLWGMTREDILAELKNNVIAVVKKGEQAENDLQALVKKTYRSGRVNGMDHFDFTFIMQRVKEYIRLLFCCWDAESAFDSDRSEEIYYENVNPADRPLLDGIKNDTATKLLIKNCLAARAARNTNKKGRKFLFYEMGGMDERSMLYWVKEYTDMRRYNPNPRLQPSGLDMYPDVYLFYVLRELSKRFVMP